MVFKSSTLRKYIIDTCTRETIIMLLVNYENFFIEVAENIIKTQYSQVKQSLCFTYNLFWFYRLVKMLEYSVKYGNLKYCNAWYWWFWQMLVSRQIVRTLRTSRSLHVQCRYLLSQSLDSVSLSRAIQRPSDVLTKSVTAFHTTSRVENEHIINIQDEADFKDRVINNEKPVVVDFHAV